MKAARQIMPEFRMRISDFYFTCPACGRRWERGGHKEGFLKAAASRHIFACWELELFETGYVLGDFNYGLHDHVAIPIAEASKKKIQAMKRIKRNREKTGSPK